MKRIISFELDHNVMEKGFYLNAVYGDIFTFDLRFKKPNGGDYLSAAVCHSIEHMVATTVRNLMPDNVIYFGPMGCRTGFYLLLRDIKQADALELTRKAVQLAIDLPRLPGSTKIECGNYRSHDFEGAKRELSAYLQVLSEAKQ